MKDRVKRCPPRFRDGDCPADVADIFDNPQFGDRYTVVYRDVSHGFIGYRAMSENPFHPQGIALYCEMRVYQFSAYRTASRRKRVAWSSLPEKVRRCVKRDCGVST